MKATLTIGRSNGTTKVAWRPSSVVTAIDEAIEEAFDVVPDVPMRLGFKVAVAPV